MRSIIALCKLKSHFNLKDHLFRSLYMHIYQIIFDTFMEKLGFFCCILLLNFVLLERFATKYRVAAICRGLRGIY